MSSQLPVSAPHQELHQTREEAINSSIRSISAARSGSYTTKDCAVNPSESMAKHAPELIEQSTLMTPLMQLKAQIRSLKPIPKINKLQYAAAPCGELAPASGLIERYGLGECPIKLTSLASTTSAVTGDDLKPVGCEVLFFDDSNGYQLKLNHETEICVLVNTIYEQNGLKKFSETVSKLHNKFMYLVFGMRGNDKEWKKIHEVLQKDRLSVKWITFESSVLSFGLTAIGGLTRIVAQLHVVPPVQAKEIPDERSEKSKHAIKITVPPNLTVRLIIGAHKLGRKLYETTVDDGSTSDAISPALAEPPDFQTKKHRRRRGKKAPKALLQRFLSTSYEDKERVAAGKGRRGFKLPFDTGADGTQGDLPGDRPSYTDLDIFADSLPTPASWLTKSRRALRRVMLGMGERMARRAERVRVTRSGNRLNTSRTQNKQKSTVAITAGPQTTTRIPQTESKTVAMPVSPVIQVTTILSHPIITQQTAKTNLQNRSSAPTKSPASSKADAKKNQNASIPSRTPPTAPDASRMLKQRASPARTTNRKPSIEQTGLAGKGLDLKSGSPQQIKRDLSTIKRVPLAELKYIKLQKSPARKTPIKAMKVVEVMKQTSMGEHKIDTFTLCRSLVTRFTPVSPVTRKIPVDAKVATTALLNAMDQGSKQPANSATFRAKEIPVFKERKKTSSTTSTKNKSCLITATKNIPTFPKDSPQNEVQDGPYTESHPVAKPNDDISEKSTSAKRMGKLDDPNYRTSQPRDEKSLIQNTAHHTITRRFGMEKMTVVNAVNSREQPAKPKSPMPPPYGYNTSSSLQASQYRRSNFGTFQTARVG